jgi:hypothetical protein
MKYPIVTSGILLLVIGCGSSTEPEPEFDGTVLQTRTQPFSVLVEEPDRECGAWLVVDNRTRIRVTTNGLERNGSIADLTPGKRVKIWVSGPMLLTCPAEGHASRIVIRSSP